ncbi:MAG TPA: B-box zinc finger protein [Pyrinomonadaceae bacterium]|nr:B-box zinc finger protein [Pyrinomonadaceae bacterium]
MNSHEVWQVAVLDRVYEANFEEIVQWIKEGAVLPEDKVRRGNLRWLSAGKVPEFYPFFFEESFKAEQPFDLQENGGEVFTSFQTNGESSPDTQPETIAEEFTNGDIDYPQTLKENRKAKVECSIHAGQEPHYICEICKNVFCRTCPESFGSNVKLCPSCKGLCVIFTGETDAIEKIVGAVNKPYRRIKDETKSEKEIKLEAKDFLNALKFPFSFSLNLIVGAVLFTALMFGLIVAGLGGNSMIWAAVGFAFLVIMLKISVFSKTLENLSQSKIGVGFMPRLNRFTFWEDFIHPFATGLGVYLVSFGMFTAFLIGAFVFAWFQFSDGFEKIETEMRGTHNQITTKINSIEPKTPQNIHTPENVQFASQQRDLEEKIEQSRQNQIASVFGDNYLGDNRELEKFALTIMRLSVILLMPLCFAFILGILYFPAACSIAGATRSFKKTINPLNGLKMIKKLGFDYIKILSLCVVFVGVSLGSTLGLYLTFSYFEFPLLGILSALLIGGIFIFYFWVVFSFISGIAVNKYREKLGLS